MAGVKQDAPSDCTVIVYGALLLPVVVTFILHFGCFLGFYVTVVIDAIINGCISVWRSCSSRYCYVL